MNQLKIAVIGAGHLGKIHTRLLAQIEDARIVAVCDPDPGTRQQIKSQFGCPVESDYRRVMDVIDAAIIATPTRFHFRIAADLMEHGIHCLIEKPLTDSVSDAIRLSNIANEKGCIVSVGHCERYNAATQTAISEVGTPRFVQAARLSSYTFRSTDIGVVHDLMIHDIDLVNSIFPGHVVDVRANGISVFGKNEDIAHARLQFSCGGVANLTASRCSFNIERSLQVFGDEGFAKADLTDQSIEVVRVPSWIRERQFDFAQTDSLQQAFVRDNLFERVLERQKLTVEPVNAILAEQKDWIRCIKNGESPVVDIEYGRQAVEIAQLVLDSLNSHKWDSEANLSGALATPEVSSLHRKDILPIELVTERRRAA